jgi:HAD superfamily hydrolase (TIGR01509 family)
MSCNQFHKNDCVVRLLRAVLLDLGETLVHLSRPWEEVFHANLEAIYDYLTKLGLRMEFQVFADTFTRVFDDASAKADIYKVEIPMQEIIAKVLRKSGLEILGVNLVQNAMMEFYRPEIEAWAPYPDTIKTLTALKADRFEMGLVSNAKSDWAVHAIVQKLDLEKFFDVIVTSAALRIRKPRAEIFNRALTVLGVKPPETVFVGDSLDLDIRGASSLGMRSIHVCREPVERPNPTGPEAAVSNLTEALTQIIAWNNGSMGPMQ